MAAAMRHEDDEETARQEVVIKFAQKLAANEKKFRDRAIKKLRKWMEVRSHAEKGANFFFRIPSTRITSAT